MHGLLNIDQNRSQLNPDVACVMHASLAHSLLASAFFEALLLRSLTLHSNSGATDIVHEPNLSYPIESGLLSPLLWELSQEQIMTVTVLVCRRLLRPQKVKRLCGINAESALTLAFG